MRIKKFAMLSLVLFCICFCGCSTMVKFYADQMSAAADYESGSIEVTNSLGEKYTVEYNETGGFPSHGMTVKIYRAGFVINNFSTKFAYSNIPNQIVYLFSDGRKDYYYAAGNYRYDSGKANHFWAKIVVHDIWGNERSEISLDPSSEMCVSFSKKLRKKINRNVLIKRFEKCGFDSEKILSVYDL